MQLAHGLHLAYCTNIHRGEDWAQTFDSLNRHTLAVRERVCPRDPYAIGLRLSNQASIELNQPPALAAFRDWLEKHNCYVFTINGFPFGKFHGARVKEQVYSPDWTQRERLEFTNRLFDILARLLPEGIEGSVSTVPCSFKEFITSKEQAAQMRAHLWSCIDHISEVGQRAGRELHLGLEPEPLCYLETSAETVEFFHQMRADRPRDNRLARHLGVNYDTCHLAVEFEEPADAIGRLEEHGIKLSKIHVSSALKVIPTAAVRKALRAFADNIYFHQVIERHPNGELRRYRDLDVALRNSPPRDESAAVEWRIHFHIPLHAEGILSKAGQASCPSSDNAVFDTTSDHILGVFKALQRQPKLCTHLEMETYTWEVMPAGFKNRSVVDQLVAEYDWTLARLTEFGLAGRAAPDAPNLGA